MEDLTPVLAAGATGAKSAVPSEAAEWVAQQLAVAPGPSVSRFLWDVNQGLPQLALERDANNSLIRRYAYGARRISQTAGSDASYFLYDGLGSVANLTSSSGATQWTWSYEPFGAIRTEQKASGQQPDNFMKFTGEYLDASGLYHLRARQYDPASGRFLTHDPLPVPPGTHTTSAYSYVSNRPTVFLDPSGKVEIRCGICEAAEAFAEGVKAGADAVVSGATHAVSTGAEAASDVARFANDQVVRAKKWVETHQSEIACGLAVGGGVVLMGSFGVAGGVLITRGFVPLLTHGLRHRGLETAAAVSVTGGFVIEHRADRGIPCFS